MVERRGALDDSAVQAAAAAVRIRPAPGPRVTSSLLVLVLAGCDGGKDGSDVGTDNDTSATDSGPRLDTSIDDSGCGGEDTTISPVDFSASDAAIEVTSDDWGGLGVQAIAPLSTEGGEMLVLGAPGWGGVSPSAGEVVLVPARVASSGGVDSVALAVIRGEPQSYLGGYVAAGDFDQDGVQDLALGAPGYIEAGDWYGAVYLLSSS